MSSAADLLQAAHGHMTARAATYDKPQGERSMARCVAAFNALTGHDLSEQDGWAFMTVLKLTRFYQRPDQPHRDSIEDGIAYLSLFGEAALSQEADAAQLARIKAATDAAADSLHKSMDEACAGTSEWLRKQARAMLDTAEGRWAHHDGGACPVPVGASLEIEFRNGARALTKAQSIGWNHYQQEDDIVSYRLVG